ncbi:MAG TPA: terminase family protein [Anaerolineae bacterium]|nr:terminase family protein [Anaerolineae bacterium]
MADVECHHPPFGQLFPWQRAWLTAIDSGRARMSHIEVHRRARKTATAINLQFRECARMPKTRHVYVGPTFAESRRIVWDDPTMLKEALPDKRALGWRLNEHHMVVRFENGSVWQCFGGDDPDSLRGADAQTFVFDEWALAKEQCWTEVLQPIFRQDKTRRVAFLYTPKGYNHATRMFDYAACVDQGSPLPVNGPAQHCRPGQFALRLTADRSGIFTPEALQEIRDDPNVTDEEYKQEYLCARIMDEEFALITSAMLDVLEAERARQKAERAIISCDPSMGGDACAVDVQWGPQSILHRSFRTRDTMRIVGELRRISDETGILDFIIDSIGIGAGIADRLKEDTRYQVIAFCSSEASSTPNRYANLRAEMWWTAREDVMTYACCKPDEETCRQIPFASRYKIGSNGKIQILTKDKIKEELNRSPDDADAWAMGRWGIRLARECAGKMMQYVVQQAVAPETDPWGDDVTDYGRGAGW